MVNLDITPGIARHMTADVIQRGMPIDCEKTHAIDRDARPLKNLRKNSIQTGSQTMQFSDRSVNHKAIES